MIITLQGIAEREDFINKNILPNFKKNDVYVYIDMERKSPFFAYKRMLEKEYPPAKYRLHLQDDIELCHSFEEYLPHIEFIMMKEGIDFLSLFAPRQKCIMEQVSRGVRIAENWSIWIQAAVFSEKLINLLKYEIQNTKETKHDDIFIQEILRKYRIIPRVHLPGIAQHLCMDPNLKSSMSHTASKNRMSPFYDPDFVVKFSIAKNANI